MDRRQASLGLSALLTGAAFARLGPSDAGAQTSPSSDFGGIPYAWITFSKEGALSHSPPALLQDPSITDFIVLSHGWQTDQPHAVSSLYGPLLRGIASEWSSNRPRAPAGRRYGALLVSWPSKEHGATARLSSVSSRSRVAATDVGPDVLDRWVVGFSDLTDMDPENLRERVRALVQGDMQQADCAALLELVLGALGGAGDAELAADTRRYDPAAAQAMFEMLSGERRFRFASDIARRQDFDRSQRARYRGVGAAICSVLNAFTYYTMKARAGDVGRGLAEQVLAPLRAAPAERIHLIGHSFGARLVTAAAFHAGRFDKLRSLTMLQGAFSQNALAPGGAFPNTHRNVAGPVLITHTHNDDAVSRYYAIASQAAGDTSRRLGGADDPFGAMGANGAQNIAGDLQSPAPSCDRAPTTFVAGKVHNMNSDACITPPNAHMNVTNPGVARVVATMLAS